MSKSQSVNANCAPGNAASDALLNMDELVKRRDAINERIAEIKTELGEIFMTRSRLEKTRRDLQDHLRGMPEGEPRYAESRQRLTAQLNQNGQSLRQTEERNKALNDELTQLQTIELPSCMSNLSAEDVLEHHRQIAAANAEMSRIQSAIDAQHQLIADARASIPDAVDRRHERHTLMAEIALGKASKNALEKLDAEIAASQKASTEAGKKVASQIADAEATVSGLEHKLKDAQQALNELESKSAEVAHRYYVGEAQKAAAQYVNHALELKRLHFLLLGLNSIVTSHDRVGILRYDTKAIQLPMFRLPQFDGVGSFPGNSPGMILDGNFIGFGDEVSDVANAEKAKLEAFVARGRPITTN